MPPPPSPAAPSWWDLERHAARRPLLLQRQRLVAAVRDFFLAQGFVEVETACLQVSPGLEPHLKAFATRLEQPDGSASTLYLHTSPEFACKKLLAAGETRIFDLSRVYRNREDGPLHASEFTMLEWYCAGASWSQVMEDAVGICIAATDALQRPLLHWREHTCDPGLEPERLTLVEAFARHARIDLEIALRDRDRLAHAAQERDVRVGPNDSWSDIFSRILVQHIEPKLGQGRLTLLCEYPAEEAALARPNSTAIHALPSGSSFMPAASSWRTALAN